MPLDGEKIAQRLARLMHALNMNQKQLAEQLEITQPAVSKYLQGRIPPAEILLLMAQLSKVSIEWILTGYQGGSHVKIAEPVTGYHTKIDLAEKIERLPLNIREDMEQLVDSLLKYF